MSRRRRKKKGRETKRAAPVPPSPRSRRGRLLPWAVLALGFGVAVVWLATGTGSFTPQAFNIVLVTADTLRADKLGAYGNRDIETPNLDRLAAEGVVFDNASTAAPLTLPAHATLLTGTYPLYHGVRDNGGYYLEASQQTLAESLRAKGYRTGAFVGAFVLDSRFGLDQGFEHYFDDFDLSELENVALNSVSRRGDEVLKNAVEWMETVREEPFFAWLHFYDAHRPYDPPEPFRSRYQDGRFGEYDGEVAYVDSLVGELSSWLKGAGLAKSTILVFVGDHGESLGDHGEDTHGFFVYDQTMRVPFLVKAPGSPFKGRRVAAQVRTIDLVPTLLEMVGADVPETVQGTSLLPLMTGRTDDLGLEAYGESIFPERYGWAGLGSLRTSHYHYIDAPRPELFDLTRDPEERDNVLAERAGTARELKKELEEIRLRYGASAGEAQAPGALDRETREKLAALGYVGSPSGLRKKASGVRADPKDKIDLYRMIRSAGTASSEGRYDRATEILEKVLARDENIPEVHNLLGDVFYRQELKEKAVSAYRRALALDPDYLPSLFSLALCTKDLGRREDAALGFERVLTLDPRSSQASFLLAEIRIEQERFAEARQVLDAVAGVSDRERALRHNLLGECHLGLNELDEAEEEFRVSLEIDAELPDASYNLGLVLEQKGQSSAAIEAYRKELESAPDNFRAHFNLARLLGQTGETDEMIEHLEKAIELNPRFATAELYLANTYLDLGRLDRAMKLAQRAIEIGPEPELVPFGHFILADVYRRLGRPRDAAREMALARKLQGS